MILFEDALEMVRQSAVVIGVERVALHHAAGRVLAHDVAADMEMPPFNKSAMDGYACRRIDLPGPLDVVEVIPAGYVPQQSLAAGQCAKIMTGAMVPHGADCVVMVEHTELTEDDRMVFTATGTADNICVRGEDVQQGDIVLNAGTLVAPQHVAVLASMGEAFPEVFMQPRMAVLSTGDELVEPDEKPLPSQIRNSNAVQLVAQCAQIGVAADYLGVARDNIEDTRAKVGSALDGYDVVILSGGVSMGDFDFVPTVLQEHGIEILFKSVAVQPGRPTVFGRRNKTFFFGLPGNPVSSFVQFELLVKPLLYGLMGCSYMPKTTRLQLMADYTRKKNKRKAFIPIRYSEAGGVIPVTYHGSAHIHAYVGADGIVALEIGQKVLKKGDWVDVRQI